MKSYRHRKWNALVALLLIILFHNASAQSNNAIRELHAEAALTTLEHDRAEYILNKGFALDHWYATIAFDPNAASFEIALPDGSGAAWYNQRVHSQAANLSSWRGSTADGQGTATLVVHNGMITGIISINPKLVYRIQPVSEGKHLVYRVNQMKSLKEESKENYGKMQRREWVPSEAMRAPHDEEPQGNNNKLTGSDCYIRILVGFDSAAGFLIADPVGFALECVELSNTIYAQSDINFEAELAFAKVYDDAASSDIDDALTAWQYSIDGNFDDVHSDREHYDADFCILVANDFDGDYVGLAATIGASYSSAFCVVEQGAAIDNLSFTHEIGHLMGARHDLYVDGSGDYNHGYIITSEKVRTVMAYNDQCDDNGYNCQRVQYFSNPDIDYPGTSKALGNASTAHNERALDENEPDFKDFEPVVTNKTFLFPETISGNLFASATAISTIKNLTIYEVKNGANVVWSAGSEITLSEGFVAESASEYEAKIGGCDATKLSEFFEDETADMASGFAISVYPDPASNDASVRFTLDEDDVVNGYVLDMAGRKLLPIVNDRLTAGEHDVVFDVRKIPSGTYLLNITTGKSRAVKKLVVQH